VTQSVDSRESPPPPRSSTSISLKALTPVQKGGKPLHQILKTRVKNRCPAKNNNSPAWTERTVQARHRCPKPTANPISLHGRACSPSRRESHPSRFPRSLAHKKNQPAVGVSGPTGHGSSKVPRPLQPLHPHAKPLNVSGPWRGGAEARPVQPWSTSACETHAPCAGDGGSAGTFASWQSSPPAAQIVYIIVTASIRVKPRRSPETLIPSRNSAPRALDGAAVQALLSRAGARPRTSRRDRCRALERAPPPWSLPLPLSGGHAWGRALLTAGAEYAGLRPAMGPACQRIGGRFREPIGRLEGKWASRRPAGPLNLW
jgi:hypothetical protein